MSVGQMLAVLAMVIGLVILLPLGAPPAWLAAAVVLLAIARIVP